MRILIVEDHQGISLAMQTLFELEGYHAICVDRGERAMEALSGSSENYDLVLLDLNTNGISAEEFMQQFRSAFAGNERTRPTIALMSGSSYLDESAKRLGADLVIRKPFDQAELMMRLASLRDKRALLH